MTFHTVESSREYRRTLNFCALLVPVGVGGFKDIENLIVPASNCQKLIEDWALKFRPVKGKQYRTPC